MSHHANFVKALQEQGVNDFDGVFKLIKAFDDVECWPQANIIEDYIIKNSDYDNAVKFIHCIIEFSGSGENSVLRDFITSRYIVGPRRN